MVCQGETLLPLAPFLLRASVHREQPLRQASVQGGLVHREGLTQWHLLLLLLVLQLVLP